MDFTPSQRKLGLVLLAGLAAVALLALGSGSSAVFGDPAPATGPAEPNVVVTGSYNCTVSEQQFIQPPSSDPLTFREITDSIGMTATGGVLSQPPTPRPPGGSQIIGGGGHELSPPLTSGIGTGHGFDGGSIEDCIRFAESVAAVAHGLDCVTSDVRHRPRLFQSESANLSFVCEGPVAAQVHAIGALSRAVLALKPQPAP